MDFMFFFNSALLGVGLAMDAFSVSLANGLNGNPYRTIPSELGGNVSYISNFCHTFTTQFCASATYFEEHPEYFSEIDYDDMSND